MGTKIPLDGSENASIKIIILLIGDSKMGRTFDDKTKASWLDSNAKLVGGNMTANLNE